MKLFTKIFLFGMLVFGAAFSASGYFLLHHALESSVSREADFALKQYQYDKFTVQSALLTYCDVSVVTTFKDDDAPWDTQICTIWEPFPDVLSCIFSVLTIFHIFKNKHFSLFFEKFI